MFSMLYFNYYFDQIHSYRPQNISTQMGSASYEVSREMRYTIGLQGIPSSNICMGENCLRNSLPVVLAYWKANAASQCANKLQALKSCRLLTLSLPAGRLRHGPPFMLLPSGYGIFDRVKFFTIDTISDTTLPMDAERKVRGQPIMYTF